MQYNRNYNFATGTTIVADQIDQEFDSIKGVINGNINTDNLTDVSVTEEKIATDAVTTSKIEDDSVTAAKIENQEAWHEIGDTNEPAFENSWVNFGSSYNTVGFMKDSLGFVHLKGLIKNGSTYNANMFTLPAGYRPIKDRYHSCSSNNAFGIVSVTSAGVVKGSLGSTVHYSLDGINFRAEQ